MNSREEKARELFSNEYNCAQSVFGVFCEDEGLDLDTSLKLATGFGGGMRFGEVCGALTGAILTIGLKCGFHIEKDLDQKKYCNDKTIEFIQKFKEQNGSILCRDLLGVDIRVPEDHTKPEIKALHKKICPNVIASAVRILEDMEG